MRHALSGLLAVATVCSLGLAQAPQPIDSGTLTMTSTTPYGTQTSMEEFTIVRNADGGFTMTTVTSGGRIMRTVLTTDSLGYPTAYEHHGKGGEAVERTITSRRDGDGALVISELPGRRPPAPFRFPANTLLFGEGGTAQVWFLGLGPVPRDVSFFELARWPVGVQRARLSEVGRESLTIDGSPVEASHLVLGDGIGRRDVWLDSQKRLLKVSLFGGNSVAVRTQRPQSSSVVAQR